MAKTRRLAWVQRGNHWDEPPFALLLVLVGEPRWSLLSVEATNFFQWWYAITSKQSSLTYRRSLRLKQFWKMPRLATGVFLRKDREVRKWLRLAVKTRRAPFRWPGVVQTSVSSTAQLEVWHLVAVFLPGAQHSGSLCRTIPPPPPIPHTHNLYPVSLSTTAVFFLSGLRLIKERGCELLTSALFFIFFAFTSALVLEFQVEFKCALMQAC